MSHSDQELMLRIFKNEQLVHSQWLSSAVVLGRQDRNADEPPPYEMCDINRHETPTVDGAKKLVIAGAREVSLSRTQALIELLGSSRVRVSNISEHVALYVGSDRLPPLVESSYQPCVRELDLDLGPLIGTVDNGECSFRIEGPQGDNGPLMTLDMATLAPGQLRGTEVAPLPDLLGPEQDLTATQLAQWLLETMPVFHTGTTADELLSHATDSLRDMIGLHYVAGLTYEEGAWFVKHEQESYNSSPSTSILQQVLDERRSFRSIPEGGESLQGISSVVAAPILNVHGEVLGALYGDRRGKGSDSIITELEQMVVELVATGVANGIARLQQQRAAMRAQVQFEQFFGPMLAQELDDNQELLEGREAEVTVLFCDIIGFSRISARVGPAKTLEWINDVLNELSHCVVDREGVLVDYVGDELMAMWGAPQPVANHAARACAAALEMKQRLVAINQRWEPIVGETTGIQVGINTGKALVGNTGSQLKFKYGPMGTAVNLGSRICRATKAIMRDVLVSGETAQAAGMQDQTRRLCSVEVVNIPNPVDVYELLGEASEPWHRLKRGYESALVHFEQSNFRQAAQELSDVLMSHPDDDPSIMLLARAVNAMINGPEPKHPVWVLGQK